MDDRVLIGKVADILINVVADIKALSEDVEALRVALTENPQTEVKQSKPKENDKKPAITLEQVRGVLADKSRDGHTAEIKALIAKYGASRLSDIDPNNFEALLKDAEVLGHAG